MNNVALLIKDGVHYCSDLATELRDYKDIHKLLQDNADRLLSTYPDRKPDQIYTDLMNTDEGGILTSIKECLASTHNYDVSQLPIIETTEFGEIVMFITSISMIACIVFWKFNSRLMRMN